MTLSLRLAIIAALFAAPLAEATCPYGLNYLNNPYGTGSPYAPQPIYVVPQR
jgi:hypothetical protein